MDAARERITLDASPRVEQYVSTGDSCPELCMNYDVDVREFVILACLNDTDQADNDEIGRLLGLSPTTVNLCIENLLENRLIRATQEEPRLYRLTTDGNSLVRKAAE